MLRVIGHSVEVTQGCDVYTAGKGYDKALRELRREVLAPTPLAGRVEKGWTCAQKLRHPRTALKLDPASQFESVLFRCCLHRGGNPLARVYSRPERARMRLHPSFCVSSR